jgi:ABC-type thiamin/hydroxymethylpyrimidine transport system permease subunit
MYGVGSLELFQYLYAILTNSMVDSIDVNISSSFAMIVFAVRMLEGMFVVGILGSVLVVVLTAFDDIRELFGRRDDKQRSLLE